MASLHKTIPLVLAALLAAGCATNPVTGRSQLMLVSEDKEIQIDKQNSPYQFSADYGTVQDKRLNDYIDRTGKNIAAQTHRTHMPFNFHVVNAVYVNAYAFPGGTIACTRGILLNLDNEAELSALIGHELGHVNARHTAEIMSKSKLTSAVVGGVAVLAGTYDPNYGGLAAQIGIEWLQSSSVEWQRQRRCFGCHVQAQVLMGLASIVVLGIGAQTVARRRDFPSLLLLLPAGLLAGNTGNHAAGAIQVPGAGRGREAHGGHGLSGGDVVAGLQRGHVRQLE